MLLPFLAMVSLLGSEPATRFRGALELQAHSFPSGTPGGSQDLFVSATPLLGFDGGADFGLELGAPLRLRAFDDPPAQREGDYGRVLRREDWDQPSDFGQLLRELRIGADESPIALWAGPLLEQSLGLGHLVGRYSNRDDPDYHPCGATAHLVLGPTRSDFLVSDLLAARLFAAQTRVDMGRVTGTDPGHFDRYLLTFGLAHDQGASGPGAPSITLMQFDFELALVRSEGVRVQAFTGLGSRVFVPVSDLGAVLGISVEGEPGQVALGGRLEVRKQAGSFRQGMFGPAYELSRFSGLGLSAEPLAEERLADGFSGYAELSFSSGGEEPVAVFSAAGEYFSSGRVDADGQLALRPWGNQASLAARAVVVGLGQRPRYLATLEGRYRFAPSLYALASAGSLHFPQPDRSLVQGFQAGIGVGADFER